MPVIKKSKIKNQKSKINRGKGQTILEVLVALTLIILFLSGIAVLGLYAAKNVSFSEKKSLATKLARQQLERARVVRDSAGIDALSICQTVCFINSQLTPIPITPTGAFGQSLSLQPATSLDCPLPEITVTPAPISYKTTATVVWSIETAITPAPAVKLSSCITDWR